MGEGFLHCLEKFSLRSGKTLLQECATISLGLWGYYYSKSLQDRERAVRSVFGQSVLFERRSNCDERARGGGAVWQAQRQYNNDIQL